MKTIAPPSEIRDWISYEPDTGLFRWIKKGKGKNVLGGVAGWKDKDGYTCITFRRVKYKAARLAIWYSTGEMPSGFADHINGDVSDNRLINLRDAPPMLSAVNRAMQSNNACGTKHLIYTKGAWQASFSFQKRKHYVGRFQDKELAAAAVQAFARKVQGEYYREG